MRIILIMIAVAAIITNAITTVAMTAAVGTTEDGLSKRSFRRALFSSEPVKQEALYSRRMSGHPVPRCPFEGTG